MVRVWVRFRVWIGLGCQVRGWSLAYKEQDKKASVPRCPTGSFSVSIPNSEENASQ